MCPDSLPVSSGAGDIAGNGYVRDTNIHMPAVYGGWYVVCVCMIYMDSVCVWYESRYGIYESWWLGSGHSASTRAQVSEGIHHQHGVFVCHERGPGGMVLGSIPEGDHGSELSDRPRDGGHPVSARQSGADVCQTEEGARGKSGDEILLRQLHPWRADPVERECKAGDVPGERQRLQLHHLVRPAGHPGRAQVRDGWPRHEEKREKCYSLSAGNGKGRCQAGHVRPHYCPNGRGDRRGTGNRGTPSPDQDLQHEVFGWSGKSV